MINNKYISVKTIAAKLARDVPSVEFDINDVVEWCAEAEKNIGEFMYFEPHTDVEVKVKNRRGELPCNIWRLLQVKRNRNCSGCEVLNYYNDGTFLNFSDNSFTNALVSGGNVPEHGEFSVFIDYIGIPMDDEGFPMVMEGHQEACYWYILTKILFEDYLENKISTDRWNFIQEMYGKYVTKAKSSMQNLSRNDIDRLAMIRMTMVRNVRMPKRNFR